jgi:hypothetical protein
MDNRTLFSINFMQSMLAGTHNLIGISFQTSRAALFERPGAVNNMRVEGFSKSA